MITKRDIAIAFSAVLVTAGLAVLAQPAARPPIMGSSAFDWNSLAVKTNAVGSVRQVFEAPTVTMERLECHITTLNPGKAPHPPHHHPEEEMIIIREGTLEVLVNGAWKRLGPGSVYFAASNVEHGLRNVGDIPAVYHVINFRTATTPKPDAK